MTSLKEAALKILGARRLTELKKWYDKTLEKGPDYVVFIVRRSYILTLIMEKITGKQLEQSSSATFLTDGSVLLHCRKMAEVYTETGHFPKILICDDILIHGRNINHLLDAIEETLIRLLPGYDPDAVRLELEKSIRINVIKIARGTSLLHGRYAKKLDSGLVAAPGVWRKLSNDISRLILESGIANASYIYSRHISEEDVERIKRGEDHLIYTKYQNTEQYSKIWCVGEGNYVKTLLTVRIVKSNSGYRMIPFAFLPNLDKTVTKKVMRLFIDQIDLDDFKTLMKVFRSYKGMRSYNEILTLLISNVVLQYMCQKYNIVEDTDDVNDEIRKLARNYNFNTLTQAQNFLKHSLTRGRFSMVELGKQLDEIIPEDTAAWLDNLTVWNDNSDLSYHDSVCGMLEDYFYEKSWDEERNAYILKNLPYSPHIDYSRRAVISVYGVLQDIMGSKNNNILDIYMAYILQMMDAGILAVSSYAPNDQGVHGFMQFAKAGEQSAAIYPMKYYDYLPLLGYMQDECEKWHIDLEWEMNSFFRKHGGFTVEKVEELKRFIKKLEMVGQKVSDWNWRDDQEDELKKEYCKYISSI